MNTFEDVTELSGAPISQEQLFRMFNRYHWTARNAQGCDVLEVGCGAGQGVGLVSTVARSVVAGDFSEPILKRARTHYGERFEFLQFDAQEMPFEMASFDVVVMHEALYYLPSADRFIAEADRVLRPDGVLLITTTNKDISDFHPSAHSTTYHGVVEMGALLRAHDFDAEFWGSQRLSESGVIQKLTRPLKRFAVRYGLMPRTMRGKEILRRIIFGKLVPMPAEITPGMTSVETLTPIPQDRPCTDFKIFYVRAKRRSFHSR
jgi:ubiquinone/menaquinone biosynthesis C-methylase UbiE